MQKIRPDLDIGGNIQQMRYQNKLTQDQVIARLNLMGIPISKSTYAKLETNRINIKVSELLALSQILHCDVGEFFKNLICSVFSLSHKFSFHVVHFVLFIFPLRPTIESPETLPTISQYTNKKTPPVISDQRHFSFYIHFLLSDRK